MTARDCARPALATPVADATTTARRTLALVRGEGARSGTPTASDYLDLVAGIAVNALGHAHPAVVEAVTAQVATLGHVSQPLRHTSRSVALAERLLALLAGRDGRVFFCQLRRRGQRGRVQARPGRTGRHRGASRAEGALPRPHHGRAGADRQAGQARAVRAAARRRHLRAVRRREALRAAVDDDDGGGLPRAGPGRGRRRRAAARLPRGRARAATRGTARCSSSTRCRPASAAPAPGSRTSTTGVAPDVVTLAKGLGGGLPDRRLHRLRRRARRCSSPASTAHVRRQPGRRAPPPSPSSTRSRPTACSTRPRPGRPRCATASLALGHPLVAGVRGAGCCCAHHADRSRSPRPSRRAARRAGFLVNAVAPPTSIRLAPPLVLTDRRGATAFARARCPTALDAGDA